MNIGAQLFTVRDLCKTPESYDSVLKRLSEIGFTCIQVSAIWDLGLETIKESADRYQLDIVLTHSPEDRIVNDTDQLIQEHKYLGATYIGLGAMSPKYSSSKEGVLQFIKDFKPAAKRIKDAGLKFMYHNHAFEFEKYENKRIIDYLIEGFEEDEMGFTLDTYWVQAGGADPAFWLNQLKNRLDTIHFKDMVIVENQQRMAEVMEGNLNWKSIFDACKNSNVKWAFIEQDDCYGKDPVECLKTSYDNLKTVGYH